MSVVTECGQIVPLVMKYTYLVRSSRAERTSPQVLTLKTRLLQASRAVHRRLCGQLLALKASVLGLVVPTDCGTNRRAGK